MLGKCPDEKPASDLGDHSYVVYLVLDGIDELYEERYRRGAEVLSAPTTEPRSFREFGN